MESRVNGDIPNLYLKLLARQVSQGIAVDSDKTWWRFIAVCNPFVIKSPDHVMAPALQRIATRHGNDSSMFVDPFVIKKTDHVDGTSIEDQHQYRCWPIYDKK